jgi:hypothetical protein
MSHLPPTLRETQLQERRNRIHGLEARLKGELTRQQHIEDAAVYRAPLKELKARQRTADADARTAAPTSVPDRGEHATSMSSFLERSAFWGIHRMSLPDDLNEEPAIARYRFKSGVSRDEIVYHGPRLTQSHKKIFLKVCALAGGRTPTETGIAIHCLRSGLAKAAGWVDSKGHVSGRSLKKVRAALRHMIGTKIYYTWGGRDSTGTDAGLISSVDYSGDDLTIVLPRSVLELFRCATKVNLNKFALTTDGVESWLYGYILASAPHFLRKVSVAQLYDVSQSLIDVKEFRRSVDAALKRLVELDLIVQAEKVRPGVYSIEE